MRDYLDQHRDELVNELIDWVRLRSVNGLPENEPDLIRSANWLAAALRATGFPTVDVWRIEGAPAVYAEWCEAPGAPTVLIYSHHDVRVTEDHQWEETAPYSAVERDGYLYGRGTSDAKGQVLSHIWGIRAHLAATGRTAPAVNLKLVIEGEEESGSAHLSDALDQHRERLDCDLVLFSDTLTWRADHPALCTSLRGMVSAELRVLGPLRDVHSGAVSGPAVNPAIELSALIGALHDDQGRITFPGFYDDVEELTEARRAELAALPYSDEDWLARSETRSIGGEHGYTVLERLWERPAIEVIGLLAGDPTGLPRAAVPAVATARLSIRTASGQRAATVEKQLRQWVASRLDDRFAYDLTVAEQISQEPYRTPQDLPALAVLAAAMEDGFGRRPGRMGNAGGGPAELLSRKLDAPVLFFGIGLPEDRWHDDDERVSIHMLLNGAATLAHFWHRLADDAATRSEA
ncbi:M20/M25/M40 family metallo-hydrolase [Actinoplanes sp. Pm04-4]|uniref:M20/M25/M40 family metallo-hydrolase n=1 Tax=Paractinoplanes pyxinae TaxID=2997416 RepID=A0ABT4AZZ2_9ACTN|nr:M20/M25/M40 family metallo-hydrolase [Actinoplanes pyxinae]MCY1139769.1 M20/M25/M40 family metallo-hydrolase [Actinoplanes pyxinae]